MRSILRVYSYLTFDECGWIPPGPRQAIAQAGFTKPAAIQAFSWKAGIEGAQNILPHVRCVMNPQLDLNF